MKKSIVIIISVVVAIELILTAFFVGRNSVKSNNNDNSNTKTVEQTEDKSENTNAENKQEQETQTEEDGIIPTNNANPICRNCTKYGRIYIPIDFRNWGSYDKTMPYETNNTNGIVYYDDGVYVVLEDVDINSQITKTEIWNYDGTEIYDYPILFSAKAEVKSFIHNNVPLGLKSKHTCFAIRLNPTVDYKDFSSPIQYKGQISVAIYYTDICGEEQVAWVQIDNLVTYK